MYFPRQCVTERGRDWCVCAEKKRGGTKVLTPQEEGILCLFSIDPKLLLEGGYF